MGSAFQPNKRTTVAVVDDDPGVLRSLQRLLAVNGFEPRTYTSARELLDEIDSVCPSCVISDLAMPELTGLGLQAKLKEFTLDYPIVFITGRGDIRSSVRAMRSGAVDFLAKPFQRSELLDAVSRAVERGRRSRKRLRYAERLATLTPREREVFERVVDGRLNKQIAGDLGITEKTVKVHRGRVMAKMDSRSVAQLARIAEQLGMPAGD